mgnify:CR=1 FL=1
MNKATSSPSNPKRVLIVGAGGFAGGFYADEALRREYDTWAGVRASTSRKWLTDSRLKFLTLDFDNPESLATALSEALPEGEKWDYIIYNLGATKALSFSDFSKINCDYLNAFLDALKTSGKEPEKFLFVSSLSAMGPGDEKGYAPFTEKMVAQPNTRYGASKLKAEMLLAMSGIPYVTLRATGLYGPRGHDYFLMFEAIAKGFDFSVGFRKQLLSFLYIEDMANAAFDALEKAPTGETYVVGHPHAYTQNEFRTIAAKAVGKKHVIGVKMPLWAVKAVSAIAEKWGVARGKPSTLNRDKFNIMKQRNWAVDVAKARRDFGFNPTVDLPEGVAKSIEWYRKEKWL